MTITGGSSLWDIASGDIDGDGKPDIAISAGSGSTYVLLNTSTASGISFGTPFAIASSSGYIAIKFVDFNNDGKLDIITNYNNQATFIKNNSTVGSLSFASPASIGLSSSTSYYIGSGDINGDGKVDLVFPSYFNSKLNLVTNASTTGTTTFTVDSVLTLAGNPKAVTICDIDNDGKPELLAATYSSQLISVYKNVGTQTPTGIPTATTTAITTQCNDGIWKTFYDPANPSNVMVAIKDNGNNLGTVTVNTYIDGSVGNYNGHRFLQRHFKITPTTQPTTAVQVRLYFSTTEINALDAADIYVNSINDIGFTKYQGPTEDGTYNPSDATSLTYISPSAITYGTAYGARYAEFTISGFSEFWGNGLGGVLPIHLVDFSVSKKNKSVDINWKTLGERNSKQFEILRSTPSQTWETVGIIDAHGNSDIEQNYSFIDFNPSEGINYYQLKEIDQDGAATFSEIKEVNFRSENNGLHIYPVPAFNQITIHALSADTKIISINLFSIDGKKLQTNSFTESVATDESIDCSGIPSGVYLLEIITNQKTVHEKVVISK